MRILTISCDCEVSVIQVVDIARALVGSTRRLTALAHCHVIQPEKNVFVLTDDTRMRQLSFFWTRSHHPQLFFTGALDPMFCGFGDSAIVSSLNFACASACFNHDASGLRCKGWRSETLPCGMR